jgi:galactonate dehydratase
MKITGVETFLANAGLRNYLFIRLKTDDGHTGIGEASLEWQEKTVETLIHEWVIDRILGKDPFDVERVIGGMIRDQYQGGSTIMTAISGVEIAMWDIIGKSCGQPVYRLIGGRYHREIPAYANGWYGGAVDPKEYARMAKDAVKRGYKALKFDPFGTAWKKMAPEAVDRAIAVVAAIREAVGPDVQLMIEYHGRLSVGMALKMIDLLEPYAPAWSEEPVTPTSIDLLGCERSHYDDDCRRRAAIHNSRFLSINPFARSRCASNGYRSLWWYSCEQEDCGDGGSTGHPSCTPLFCWPGFTSRSASLRCFHTQFPDPGSLC